MTTGKRIKELREKRGMSQVDLADKISVSKQTLYKYENDIITNIPSDKIESIAKVFNISPAYLMGWQSDDDSSDSDGYYTNPETARLAQELFETPGMRILFDAARDSNPKDLQMAADLLKRLKGLDD